MAEEFWARRTAGAKAPIGISLFLVENNRRTVLINYNWFMWEN